MSEQEASTAAESSGQVDVDTPQDGPAVGESDHMQTKDNASGIAEETSNQDKQEELPGPKQDSEPAEASPGTGTAAEEGKMEPELSSVPKEDASAMQESQKTEGEGVAEEGAPQSESEQTVAEDSKEPSPEAAQPQESPGASAKDSIEPSPEAAQPQESPEASAKDSIEPSPEAAEPQESPGATVEDVGTKKEEQTSKTDNKSEEKGSDVKDPTKVPKDAAAEAGEAGEGSPEKKVVIVTGSNSGIGLVAAEKLARDGYEVIMACRSEEKAKKAMGEVKKKVPGADVSFMKLDLSSLRSVREFADEFRSLGKPLHVLCNNAGLTTGFSSPERQVTEDGFEMTMGVNHLGHFLLTHLLLDKLKRTAEQCGEARIVHTSSLYHDPEKVKRGPPAHLDFENLMLDKPGTFDGSLAYKNSKLANCVFSIELVKRLEGMKVTSNTLCPGFIPSTDFLRNETIGMKIRLFLAVPFLKLFGVTRTLEHGGGQIYDVATNPKWKGVTGKHFTDFKETLSSEESREPEVGKKLWDMSADLVKYEQAKAM